MAGTLRLEIVTPEGTVYSEDVEMVTLPGIAGQMGILPRHVPLIAQMVPGEMIVRKDGREVFVATGEGLIEVTGNRVAILTDLAIPADRIDEAKAEEARQRAEEILLSNSSEPGLLGGEGGFYRQRWLVVLYNYAYESRKRIEPHFMPKSEDDENAKS